MFLGSSLLLDLHVKHTHKIMYTPLHRKSTNLACFLSCSFSILLCSFYAPVCCLSAYLSRLRRELWHAVLFSFVRPHTTTYFVQEKEKQTQMVALITWLIGVGRQLERCSAWCSLECLRRMTSFMVLLPWGPRRNITQFPGTSTDLWSSPPLGRTRAGKYAHAQHGMLQQFPTTK